MKIRALVDDSPWSGFKKGDVFEATLNYNEEAYIFIDKDGNKRLRFRFIGDFEVVNEVVNKERESIIKELEGLNFRAWSYGTYEDIHVHVSEMNALDKAIEILKGMRR